MALGLHEICVSIPEISRHSNQRGSLRRKTGEWWVAASEGLSSAQGYVPVVLGLGLVWSTIYGTDVHTCHLIFFFFGLPLPFAISFRFLMDPYSGEMVLDLPSPIRQ